MPRPSSALVVAIAIAATRFFITPAAAQPATPQPPHVKPVGTHDLARDGIGATPGDFRVAEGAWYELLDADRQAKTRPVAAVNATELLNRLAVRAIRAASQVRASRPDLVQFRFRRIVAGLLLPHQRNEFCSAFFGVLADAQHGLGLEGEWVDPVKLVFGDQAFARCRPRLAPSSAHQRNSQFFLSSN